MSNMLLVSAIYLGWSIVILFYVIQYKRVVTAAYQNRLDALGRRVERLEAEMVQLELDRIKREREEEQ